METEVTETPRDAGHGAAAAPVLTVGEAIRVWALGEDRFRVESPQASRELRGYKLMRVVAHEMAEKLRRPELAASS